MATVNYIPEHKQSPSAMRGVMDYCRQKFKVHDPVSDRGLISGVHCSGENAYDEFMLTKQVYGKTTGVNFYQYTQSFDSRDTISSADAHALALEFAEKAGSLNERFSCAAEKLVSNTEKELDSLTRSTRDSLDTMQRKTDSQIDELCRCTIHWLKVMGVVCIAAVMSLTILYAIAILRRLG